MNWVNVRLSSMKMWRRSNWTSLHFILFAAVSSAQRDQRVFWVDGGLYWIHICLCAKCISDEAADRWGKVAAFEERAELLAVWLEEEATGRERQSVRWRATKEAVRLPHTRVRNRNRVRSGLRGRETQERHVRRGLGTGCGCNVEFSHVNLHSWKDLSALLRVSDGWDSLES